MEPRQATKFDQFELCFGLNTVGKKTVRMFVIIQRFLNNSRTIKAIDLKFLGHTVVYVVYLP